MKKNNEIWLICSAIVITLGVFVACICGMDSMALTPHSRIDSLLNQLDQSLGFNLPRLMNWTWSKDIYVYICNYAYNSWVFQVTLIPILITALGKYKRALRYYFSFTFSYALAELIYYFWPTTAPATVVHNNHFSISQQHLVQNFILMRAGNTHLLPTTGLISFPSLHVAGAMLIIMLTWKNKILRWPILLLNIVLIYATMGLGYHYLVDVLAGMLIACTSFYLSGLIGNYHNKKTQH